MPKHQLTLGPMALKTVGGPMPTHANSAGAVDFCTVVLKAGGALGLQDKELADIFGLSAPDFSASFSPNRSDRNRLMKVALPMVLARQVALQLCEATGLAVSGPDAERHALADLLNKCAEYVRVMGR